MALLLLLLASIASAEFLTPFLDHDNGKLPKLCEEDTVLSCDLVQVDIASLYTSTLVFNGTTLNFLDQPGDNSFTFSSEDGDEATFTVNTELGTVWGHVQLADCRAFIIEPSLNNCKGCHVVIEEDLDAFPHDQAQAVPMQEDAEKRSNSARTRTTSALLDMGKTDTTTVVYYTIKLYYTPEVREYLRENGTKLPTVGGKVVTTVQDMARLVIDITNQGYMNSKIPIRAVLHCLEETKVNEAFFTSTPKPLDTFRDYM